MSWVIGVDTGGTFTDAFAADGSGRVASAKTPSTPPDFAQGFMSTIEELASDLGLHVREFLSDTDYVVHGTTTTLNALVTGDVAQVGFLTTRGHADSISIMNLEGRYAGLGADEIQNMARTNKPPALVPRHRVRELDERVDYKGSEVVPLDEQGARTAIRELIDDGVEAIAVSLLWAFANPVHEQRLRELVHEFDPDLFVALSSEVSPRIREYARSATTIMSTQVGPRLRRYLAPLEASLQERGFRGALLVMQGSGGCVTALDAPTHAITTIGSVLTGGIIGCTRLADALEHRNVISTDMGGTTFLVGLVRDGQPVTTTGTVLNQYSISTPMVDVHTIGAGGGAVAWVDAGGNLHVGPRSAGARPGPACYGDGGSEPTVTDVDVLLGIVNPDNFLGGRKKLHVDLAEAAVRRDIAEPLGLTVEDAAAAVYAIQNAQTADLVRRWSSTRGRTPGTSSSTRTAVRRRCTAPITRPNSACVKSSCRSAPPLRCSPPTGSPRPTSSSRPSCRPRRRSRCPRPRSMSTLPIWRTSCTTGCDARRWTSRTSPSAARPTSATRCSSPRSPRRCLADRWA